MNRLGRTALVAAAVLLAGCRELEQHRPLTFEPGVYRGEKTPSLTEEQLRSLQDRARNMR